MYWENYYTPFYDFASLFKIKNESILMYQCATNIYSRRIINVFVQYAPLKWLPVNGNNKQWGGFQWLYQHCVRNILGDECQYVNNQGVERSICYYLFMFIYLWFIIMFDLISKSTEKVNIWTHCNVFLVQCLSYHDIEFHSLHPQNIR